MIIPIILLGALFSMPRELRFCPFLVGRWSSAIIATTTRRNRDALSYRNGCHFQIAFIQQVSPTSGIDDVTVHQTQNVSVEINDRFLTDFRKCSLGQYL